MVHKAVAEAFQQVFGENIGHDICPVTPEDHGKDLAMTSKPTSEFSVLSSASPTDSSAEAEGQGQDGAYDPHVSAAFALAELRQDRQ
jgi:hypothetical protein